MHNFNPHSHEGSDISNPNFSPIPPSISIHTPTKGATHLNARYDLMYKFQSTLPRRERQPPYRAFEPFLLHFNPHSHEGSDGSRNGLNTWFCISIHTPTKGATKSMWLTLPNGSISIHTPTKGATLYPGLLSSLKRISIHTPTKGATKHLFTCRRHVVYFNPHSHEGSDCRLLFPHVLTSFISIHTPTKGATIFRCYN